MEIGLLSLYQKFHLECFQSKVSPWQVLLKVPLYSSTLNFTCTKCVLDYRSLLFRNVQLCMKVFGEIFMFDYILYLQRTVNCWISF